MLLYVLTFIQDEGTIDLYHKLLSLQNQLCMYPANVVP